MSAGNQEQVTGLLARASAGDRLATEELFPLVYDELRRLAGQHLDHERTGHTLQPTALVHEAFMRLVGPGEVSWESRAHFFGAAAQAIRRVLVDHARSRGRLKRGGPEAARVSLESVEPAGLPQDAEILALEDALKKLAELDEMKARVVELRYFAGLSQDDTARVLNISVPTVARYWQFARTWLHHEMRQTG